MFAGLVCLSAYGFYSARLFSQWLWFPVGLHRLEIFVVCWAISAAGFILWQPQWLRTVALAAGLACTFAAVGILAPLAALYVFLSSLMLGRCVLHTQADEDDPLALALGLSLWVAAVSLAVHFPVNYPAAWAIVLAAPILWKAREMTGVLRRLLVQFGPQSSRDKMETAALALVVFALAAQCIVTLKPEVSSDGLGMHLVIPAQVAARHFWAFDFREFTWALMPMGGDWAFTLAYLLGGEYAARLLNFCLLALICAMLDRAMRRWVSRPLALLAVALFAITPLVQLETGSLFVENFWTALFVAAILATARFHETGRTRYLFAAAALLGTTLAVKFGALAFAVPALAFLAAELIRRRERPMRWLAAMVVFFACAAPPYVNAWRMTGNPVFPFMSRVFQSPYFDPALQLRNERYLTPLSWRTPYEITFRSARYLEGQDGSLGFQYLLLLPMAILLVRRGWPYLVRVSLAASLAGFVLTFLGQSYLRYIYPALPLFTIAIFTAIHSTSAGFRRVLIGAAAAVFFLNVYFLPASGYYHQDFFLNLRNRAEVDQYLERSAPERKLVEYLNSKGPDIRVAFLDRDTIGDLHGRAFAFSWRSYQYYRALAESGSADEDLRVNAALGITYFIAPTKDSGITLLHVYTRDFLEQYAVPEYQFGKYYVARLRDECRTGNCEPLSAIPLLSAAPPGTYDDRDRHFVFRGPWTRGNFAQAADGSATYTNQTGAAFDFRFTGTSVTWIFARASNRGWAQVTIDGRNFGVVDQYALAIAWQSSRTFANLGPGDHLMTVRVLGKKSPGAVDSFIDVDQFVVR